MARIIVHTVFSTKERRPFLRDSALREELHRYLGGILSQVNAPSNAQRAVQALLAKDIIDRDNGSFLITDRFFRLWIQSAQSV